MENTDFANQTNIQLGAMLITTLVFFVSSFFGSTKDSFIKLCCQAIQTACSYITLVTIFTLLITSNSATTGVLSPDDLPWWMNPWWLICEILFIINLYFNYQKHIFRFI